MTTSLRRTGIDMTREIEIRSMTEGIDIRRKIGMSEMRNMISTISTINMANMTNMTNMTNTISMGSRKIRMEIDMEIVETTIGKRRRVNRGEDTHANNRDRNGRKKEVKTKMKNEAEAERTRRMRKTKKKTRLLIIDINLMS